MSADVHPSNILLHFDNHLNYLKAKNLHSLCIAQSIQYIYSKTGVHSSDYKCRCFKCLVCRMLLSVLISRGHLKLLLIVTCKNYMYVANQNIYDSLEIKSNGGS